MWKRLTKGHLPSQNDRDRHAVSYPEGSVVFGLMLLFLGVLFAGASFASLALPQRLAEATPVLAYPLGNGWNWQNPLPAGNTLNAVDCPTTDECYAVGDKGTIISLKLPASPDWQLNSSGITQTLLAVSCSSPGKCLAGGAGGSLLRTEDSGQSWTPLPISTTSSIGNLKCLAGSICYLSDGYNLFKTNDFGSSWASLFYSTTSITSLSCPQADKCYTLQKDVLSTTTDGGQSWSSQVLSGTAAYQENYHHLSCPSVTTCYVLHSPHASGLGGGPTALYQLLKTTDGGQTWSALFDATNPFTSGLTNITCPTENSCYALGKDNFYITSDGGQNWQAHSFTYNIYMQLGQAFNLSAISCPGVVSCYAVGVSGEIFATSDGGQSWQNELGGTIGFLRDLDCVDVANCYIAVSDTLSATGNVYTQSNYLLTTTSAGANWVSQPKFTANDTFESISCPARQICYVGTTGPLYKTTDGGQSWHTYPLGAANGGLSHLKCPSLTVCYGTDISKGTIYKTTDGGQNWSSQVITATAFKTVECVTENNCYAGGAGLFKTTDGGQTWSLVTAVNQPHQASIASISCPDSQTCYASPAPINCVVIYPPPPGQLPCYLLYKTTDGGQSWNTLGQVGGLISCPAAQECYRVFDGISYTGDGGASWTKVTSNFGDFIKCPLSCVAAQISSIIVGNYNWPEVAYLTLEGPASAITSQTLSYTLTARTISGTVASGYRGTVHFNADSGAELPSDYTFTPQDQGVHTFGLKFNTAGDQPVMVTDTRYRMLTATALTPVCATLYSVTRANDDGSGVICGTLSYALNEAQKAQVPLTITLNSPVITITGALPVITPSVAITISGGCNGTGQVGIPGVRLVGTGGAGSTGLTLTQNMSLEGVAIGGFSGYGLVVGDNNTLSCSWIGSATAGDGFANGAGVRLLGGGNRLGLEGATTSGNLICGNFGAGIVVENGSRGNSAYYNLIGIAQDGLSRLPNGGGGVRVLMGGQLQLGRGNFITN